MGEGRLKLDQKILDYLDHVDGYRLPYEIARAVGATESKVTRLCGDLYWDAKNGMQRVVHHAYWDRDRRGLVPEKLTYATKYFVEAK